MRHTVLLALVLAGLVAAFVIAIGGDASAKDETIAWETDLAVAKATSEKTGRPLMVVFR